VPYNTPQKFMKSFMIASLTAVVLSVTRYELCLGGGLPYGAIFSGLQVSRPSFLWSQELWGLITSNETRLFVKVRLVALIVVAVILGVAVGPASANAMMPRSRSLPIGNSTSIWLNATEAELSPAVLDGSTVPPRCADVSGQPGPNFCPSSSWEVLAGYASLASNVGLVGPSGSNWKTSSPQSLLGLNFLNQTLGLTGRYASRSMYIDQTCPGCWHASVPVTTQPAAVAEALVIVQEMWNIVASRPYFIENSSHTLQAKQPLAAVHCLGNNVISDVNDSRPLPFEDDNLNPFSVASVTRSQLLRTPGNAAMPRLLFVDLFNLSSSNKNLQNVSLGAVIIDSQNPHNVPTFATCSIYAGWASTHLRSSTASTETMGGITPENLSSVQISTQWAKFLNPTLNRSDTTVFESLTSLLNSGNIISDVKNNPKGDDQDVAEGNLAYAYEIILAALVTNGLANVGILSTLQGNLSNSTLCAVSGSDPATCIASNSNSNYFEHLDDMPKDWIMRNITHSVSCRAYNKDGVVIKIAICVLLVYALVAVVHMFFGIAIGYSSSSWQSVSELTALAMNSPQEPALQNTCAGIYGVRVFKKRVRVVAVDDEEGKQGEKGGSGTVGHLQLIFGGDTQGVRKLATDTEYGHLELGSMS